VLEYEVDSESDLRLGEDEEVSPAEPRREREDERGRRDSGGRRGWRDEGPPRRRRRRGRGGRRDERRDEPAPRASDYSPTPGDLDDEEMRPREEEMDDVFAELPELDDVELAPRPTEPAQPRSESDDRGERPRRRRRRGRGGRGDSERGDQRRPDELGARREARVEGRPGIEQESEDGDELEYPARTPRPPDMPEDESDLEVEAESEAEAGEEAGHPVHKKIPTWQEAVGILVEANMAARANSPQRGHHGRRGRGRR
jgi:ribonuclease E